MYNTKEVETNITFDKILSNIDDYYIYCYYLNQMIKTNRPIRSPLRNDRHPSWSIYKNEKGLYIYKDFATGDSGNAIKFVQALFGLNYNEALKKVWQDLVIKKPKEFYKKIQTYEKEPVDKKCKIEIKKKNFTQKDLDYWNQFGIQKETLKKYNVIPVSIVWINGIQTFYYTEKEPIYVYRIFDKLKVYRPLSNIRYKWRSNCSSYDIQGLEQLKDNGNLLIITKSLKDVMSLYELGYDAVAPQSEVSHIPKVIMNHLKSRFKNILIFFDNDSSGEIGAKKLSEEYSIPYTYIPKHYYNLYNVKDVSDLVKNFGKKEALKVIKQAINEAYNKKQES